ncbi:hypothetical protein CH340_14935 [Rhodoplanes serenus]|nr:hypothetical protein CH340_14935 [Rhodoplanes serenus]
MGDVVRLVQRENVFASQAIGPRRVLSDIVKRRSLRVFERDASLARERVLQHRSYDRAFGCVRASPVFVGLA